MRQFLGYGRFEGQTACCALEALYEPLRCYMNFFQPTPKLVRKETVGGKVCKRYDTVQTLFQRRLLSPQVSEETKMPLQRLYETLNPVALLRQLDRLQD